MDPTCLLKRIPKIVLEMISRENHTPKNSLETISLEVSRDLIFKKEISLEIFYGISRDISFEIISLKEISIE